MKNSTLARLLPVAAIAAFAGTDKGGGGLQQTPVPVPEGNAAPDYTDRSSWKKPLNGINQRQRRKRERQTGRR